MRTVIIGGSHAGIACATRAKKEYPEMDIVLFEKKSDISFISQSIPYFLMGKNDIMQNSSYTTASELKEHGIDVKTEHVVRKIDTEKKRIFYVQTNSEEEKEISYDKLVLATGSYPVIPMLNGEINKNLFILKNLEDAIALKKFMDDAATKSIVVIGGGLIGTEVSQILCINGMEVTMIQAHDRVLNKYLDKDASKHLEQYLKTHHGVEILTNTLAVDFSTRETGLLKKRTEYVVETDNHQKIVADGVVIAVGFRPNSYMLKDQVKLGNMGAIEVDDYMETSVKDVFAVGDCSTTYEKLFDDRLYLPHASDAIRQGKIAAINLVEKRKKLNSSQGTYNMNLENYTVCVSGITLSQAKKNGYDADIVYARNSFLNNSAEGKDMWLVFERGTHKILGIQLMATKTANISGYVNIISLAIERGLTIEDIEFTDFYFEHYYKNPDGLTKILAEAVREKDPVKKED